MKNEKSYNVGEEIVSQNASWTFGGEVAKSFTKHVSKSVPFYNEAQELILKISDYFVKEESICYELGVSTASLTKKLAKRHPSNVKWVGIDIEKQMIDQAKIEIKQFDNEIRNIELHVEDINLFDYIKSDLMISYYTIQFIHPKSRQEIINKIYDSLNWGGGFIYFEKVRGSDARFQDIFTGIYNDYKLDQGYSGNEIIAKMRSLKGVLEPFSTQGNIDLLKRAGFLDITTVFKYCCFEGFLAIK